MATVSGRISIVQEGRFVLEDDRGGHRLFLLSHASPFNPEDLRALARRQQRIEVAYTEPADLVAAVAHRIALLEPASDGKIPHGWADTIPGFLADWSLLRQLKGESARSAAAESAESAHLRPRLS